MLKQPPTILKETTLLLDAMVESGSRIRGEKGKEDGKEFRFNGEANRSIEDRRIIFIKSEDEGTVKGDAVTVEQIDDLPILLWTVLGFMDLGQIQLGNRFEADQKADTPALCHPLNVLGVFQSC